MEKPVFYLFIHTILINITFAIIAFDCGTPTNITTLSNLDIKKCEIPIEKPHIEITKIQLLQTIEFSSIKIIQCKVKVKRIVRRCGMFSHISVVSGGDMEYIEEVSKEQCEHMHAFKIYKMNNIILTNILTNSTNSRSVVLAGKIDNSGSCKGTEFSDQFGSWSDVIVQAQIFITLQDYIASVKLEDNEIILRSGVRCLYKENQCIDIEGGITFWDLLPKDFCDLNKFAVLFEGQAQYITDETPHKFGEEIYSLNTKEVTFALAAKGEITTCGYKLIKTENPRLFIIDQKNSDFFKKRTNLASTNVDIFTYLNTKFIYLERHIRNQIISLYNDVTMKQCNLEREILFNELSLAKISPADFAYQYYHAPGYLAQVSGEEIRLLKCLPMEVTPRKAENCFEELPVFWQNHSYFITPRSHILVKTGTQIDCNPSLAPKFNFNGTWIQVLPEWINAIPPDQLSPQTKRTWNYTSIPNIMSVGIYTPEILDKYRHSIIFPLEKPAIINTIARDTIGFKSIHQGINYKNILNEDMINESVYKTWNNLWSKWLEFGNITSAIIGIIFICRTIKFLVDTVVHGYTLHIIYGWSIYLIGAIWDSITHLLVQLGHVKETEKKETIDTHIYTPDAPPNYNSSEIRSTFINIQNPEHSQHPYKEENTNVLPSVHIPIPMINNQEIKTEKIHPSLTINQEQNTPNIQHLPEENILTLPSGSNLLPNKQKINNPTNPINPTQNMQQDKNQSNINFDI